jgi:hypothetical protein
MRTFSHSYVSRVLFATPALGHVVSVTARLDLGLHLFGGKIDRNVVLRVRRLERVGLERIRASELSYESARPCRSSRMSSGEEGLRFSLQRFRFLQTSPEGTAFYSFVMASCDLALTQ